MGKSDSELCYSIILSYSIICEKTELAVANNLPTKRTDKMQRWPDASTLAESFSNDNTIKNKHKQVTMFVVYSKHCHTFAISVNLK